MIEQIREEMYRKLEETASSQYSNYYYDLFGWSLSLSDDEREKHIETVSHNDWCSELAVKNYEMGKLSLIKAYILLLLHKHTDAAKLMLPALKAFDIMGGVSSENFINIAKSKLRVSDEFKKEVYSENNSKNASGPKNKHYELTISILIATWNEYPDTSKNAMVKAVYAHFEGKVSEQSISRWIKEKGFGPKRKVRPCPPFKLVIPS